MSAASVEQRDVSARSLWALAALALPLSTLLSAGLGLTLMAWEGCRHLTASWGSLGAAVAVMSAGAMFASLVGNIVRSRRSFRLASEVSHPIESGERLESVRWLARRLKVPCPELRLVLTEMPLAIGVLGRPHAIVVSKWVVESLSSSEWEAVIAHELAHMRRGDRLVRWLGAWLRGVTLGRAGTGALWERLDAAIEATADHAAIAVLGDANALQSARAKFYRGTSDRPTPPELALALALAPQPWPERMAVMGLGFVATLPILPLVVVPLCISLCKP